MNDCIERKKAIERIQSHVKPQTAYGEGYLQAIEHATTILELMPTIDVQPVVRCKDCKHRKEHHYEECGEKPYIKYECKFTKYSMGDDGYCSFGVRRDSDVEASIEAQKSWEQWNDNVKAIQEHNLHFEQKGDKYERDDTTKEDKEKPESNTKAFEEIKEQFVDKKKDFKAGDKVWVRKDLTSPYAETRFITEAGEIKSRVFFSYSNKEMVLDNRLLIKA